MSGAAWASPIRPARYTAVAIVLHWLIALGIVAQLAMGLVMVNAALALPQKFALFQWHKSVGITVLMLVLLRILWRLAHAPPPLPSSIPGHERIAAHVAHAALYLFMLGMPLTGWALVTVAPLHVPTVLFGQVPWPEMPVLATLADKKPAHAIVKPLHDWGGILLLFLVLLHAAAALRHHFALRDSVLARMLPIFGDRS